MEAKERTTMKFSSRNAKCTGTSIKFKKDPDTGKVLTSEIESVELTLVIPAEDISLYEQAVDMLGDFALVEGATGYESTDWIIDVDEVLNRLRSNFPNLDPTVYFDEFYAIKKKHNLSDIQMEALLDGYIVLEQKTPLDPVKRELKKEYLKELRGKLDSYLKGEIEMKKKEMKPHEKGL